MQYWCKKTIQIVIAGLACAFLNMALAAPTIEGIQVYQKNLGAYPASKQRLAEDINRYHNADDLWEVIREGFRLEHYEDDPMVQQQINWFMTHQQFLLNSANRAAPYLYFILLQAKKRHLPTELVLLPMIESAYNPFAYSTAGAAGIWQMMPNTASGYGIKQDWWYDGRRDIIASTKAALTYLSYLGNFFEGNWLLAIAAYDTGQGNVITAINKNIRDGKSTAFWYLPLAQETREYVPRLLALATIIGHPDIYPVYFPPVRNAPYLGQVDIGAQVNLKHAAYLAGLSLKQLMQLNPGYNRTKTDPNGPYKLVLPIENVAQFTENLDRLPLYRRLNWQHYKVKSGDTLFAIAKRFNVSPLALRQTNQLARNNIQPGTTLVIPHGSSGISKTILDLEKKQRYIATNKSFSAKSRAAHNAQMGVFENISGRYQLQPGDTVYMARNGDNINHIAKHFRITEKTLRATNQLSQYKAVYPGEKLIIPTHIVTSQFAKVNHKKHYQLAPGDTVYVVRAGDSIEKIAKKFHTTPPAIRVSNLLADNTIQDGDKLVIPTHL